MNHDPYHAAYWEGRKNGWITPSHKPFGSTQSRARRRGPTWRLGNAHQLKRLRASFVETTGMHGAKYMFGCEKVTEQSYATTCLYRILYVLCVIGLIISVYYLIADSFSKESIFISTMNKDSSSGKDEDRFFPLYPRVSICRQPSWKTDVNETLRRIVEYATLAFGHPYLPFTPEEAWYNLQSAMTRNTTHPIGSRAMDFHQNLAQSRELYQKTKTSNESFNLKKFIVANSVSCGDLFIDCYAMSIAMPCCHMFKSVMTSMGPCYTMTADPGFLYIQDQMKSVGFSFIINLKSPPHLEKAIEKGFRVYLVDPKDSSAMLHELEANLVVPGYITSLVVKLVKTQRTSKFRSWHGLTAKCPLLPEYMEKDPILRFRFIKADCRKHFLSMELQQYCQCQWLLTESSNSSLRVCDPDDMLTCFLQVVMKDNLTKLTEVCPSPCIEYIYKSEASYAALGGTNISRVSIIYDASNYVYNEYRQATFSGLFSQIGGSLGLYMGASIITVVELALFIIHWLWYRLLPTRR